ncbi:alkaline phosphatase family protein [Halarchaeum nitratireducens]|uniref:Sulfatase n=1 Tax=Halarchaeum nitratireducens TaxID=489913 RepID=A0A830G7P1_9EURY|nr:hypothetical protein [Halarchaeum nitratireducens]GGN09853.1 hypothetical protein GCM10009021_06880 [Halarchaeum nitratireducens]
MDARSRLSRALGTPRLFLRHANRLYHRRFGLRSHDTAGDDPFDAEWDTLVLLDGCRYDTFARRADLPGTLERRRSPAASTVEFLRATVDGRDLRDTVYVTANPQLRQHDDVDASFHAVVDVWREDGWDDETGTVLPETMTASAREAARDYPEKRLVVHYMQPHYPFVEADTTVDKGHLDGSIDGENVWNRLLAGDADVDPEVVRDLYAENLDRALPHVAALLDDLGGRTVVTADHGNMLGERAFPIPYREWGHPRGLYTDELVTVPWLVVERGERRTITRGESDRAGRGDDAVVRERLRDLGYAE